MLAFRDRGPSVRSLALPFAALAAILVLLAAALAVRAMTEIRPVASPSDYITADLAAKPQGVDASKWQHPSADSIDWAKAAEAGKKFAFLKATDTFSRGNDYFDSDAKAARAAGMYVGAYHKAHPGSDAKRQAEVFSQAVLDLGGEQLPPVLDLELDEGLSPSQLADWTRTFMDTVKAQTGRTPIMYTYKYFWLVQMGNTKEFSEYPLWLAEYRQQQPTEPLIGGWDSWTFWQYAGNDGRSPGFDTAVDLNVFNGTEAQLAAMVGPVGAGAGDTPSPEPSTPSPSDSMTTDEGDSQRPGTTGPTDQGGTDDGTIGGGSTAAGDGPLTITIPDIGIPQQNLPAGIKLPMTITLPAGVADLIGTGSAEGGAQGGDTSGLAMILKVLGSLPADALKSALIR